jgi:plasmid stability protein
MATVIVELPAESYEQLTQRAAAAGKTPEALSRDILEAALVASAPAATATAEAPDTPPPATEPAGEPPTAREILKAAGHLVELSPELRSLIIPGVTLEEVQEALTRAGGPSLSDIIIEQRGPKV